MSNTDLIARLNDALPKANEPEARFTVVETSDVREAADDLTAQAATIANLKTVMIAAAEEISAHWEAHCDAEGYGPANLMRRLEDGIPSEYGYTAGAFAKQAATIAEQAAQIERLTACLKTANSNHEHFEREWYLRGDELEALRADAERHSKATLMLSGMFSRNCMAMQAALADMMLRGHEQGWQWIINSLDGPGLLPDMAEVKAAGGAQAWFDAELAEEEARVAAMQSGKAAEPDATKCRKCNGNMRPGTYLEQTFSGVPDFPGDTHAVTVSPSGPGRLAECLKCDACGHSVTAGKAVTP